ncbi:MAG: hypothetical protein A3E82_02255 [Gammaproteobacteria bacterium RIFCSPHIGHO2_12_FULL_38_11]|nr:MAG: hypothetical protein A3E82_02255 [Gammaproteobacteria bacterium RIFCSPHIGHO2_12_FULL_38_11]
MENDIIINKCRSIRNCIINIRNAYPKAREIFLDSYILQNSVVLDLQRAIQITIDIAAHIVRKKALDLPRESKDLFESLYKHKIITQEMCKIMIGMVGFRNIAVHEYRTLDLNVVMNVVENHLTDFEKFIQEILKAN